MNDPYIEISTWRVDTPRKHIQYSGWFGCNVKDSKKVNVQKNTEETSSDSRYEKLDNETK